MQQTQKKVDQRPPSHKIKRLKKMRRNGFRKVTGKSHRDEEEEEALLLLGEEGVSGGVEEVRV